MIKLALGIEYDGTSYCGWQNQKELSSIQTKIEYAISKIANHTIKVVCAGRTDAGVHSKGQVIHFETIAHRTDKAWTIGVNSNLPKDISISWMKIVPPYFHARYSAISRRYLYIIYNSYYKPAILNKKVLHFSKPLNIDKMNLAAQYLIGENDFSAFRSSQCQSKSPFRNLINIKILKYDMYIVIDITANSFLHHMIRNIVGSLIKVGCGEKDEKWFKMLLYSKNRKFSAATSKPHGLYLISVEYPKKFNLPKISNKMFFLN